MQLFGLLIAECSRVYLYVHVHAGLIGRADSETLKILYMKRGSYMQVNASNTLKGSCAHSFSYISTHTKYITRYLMVLREDVLSYQPEPLPRSLTDRNYLS